MSCFPRRLTQRAVSAAEPASVPTVPAVAAPAATAASTPAAAVPLASEGTEIVEPTKADVPAAVAPAEQSAAAAKPG